MRDITHIFDATPLKNKTYTFYSTLESSPVIQPYYTVNYIKNFSYDTRSNTRFSLWSSMHDIAHVIDLYERGHKERLLLTEFGWPIVNGKWPRNDLFKELRVLTLQSFMCRNTFGWSRNREYSEGTKRELRRNSKIRGNFLPTKAEWDAKVAEYARHCERVGYDNYIKIWQDACRYVKNNR